MYGGVLGHISLAQSTFISKSPVLYTCSGPHVASFSSFFLIISINIYVNTNSEDILDFPFSETGAFLVDSATGDIGKKISPASCWLFKCSAPDTNKPSAPIFFGMARCTN